MKKSFDFNLFGKRLIRYVGALSRRNSSFVLDGYVDTASAEYKQRFIKNETLTKDYHDVVARVKEGGGEKATKRHVEVNKKVVVRERVKLLLDNEKDFLEIGGLAGWNLDYGDIPSAGSVMGIGPVSGRLCLIFANDATVKGGTIYPIGVKKQLRGQEIAKVLRLPCVYVVDSGGAFLPLQSELFPDSNHGGRVFYNQAVMGAEGIPQIAVVCGSCTAGAAYIPTMADNAIIVDRIGSVFLGGPPLVRAALGEVVSSEELGGATLHCRTSGCTDYFARDEVEAFKMCREVVAHLNTPSFSPSEDKAFSEPLYSPFELKGLVGQETPSRSYIDSVLARTLDESKFFEFRALYGSSLVTGFGKIGDNLVGVVASVGLPICKKSSQKACQFVQMCSQQDVPMLFVHNTMHEGWNSDSSDAESLKNMASLMSAIACCESPKITLLIGNSFGADYLALCGRSFDPTFVFAWPNSYISIVKQGIKAPWLDNNDESESEYVVSSDETTSMYAASRLWVDAIVLPEQTRQVLKLSLNMIQQPKRPYKDRDFNLLRF